MGTTDLVAQFGRISSLQSANNMGGPLNFLQYSTVHNNWMTMNEIRVYPRVHILTFAGMLVACVSLTCDARKAI